MKLWARWIIGLIRDIFLRKNKLPNFKIINAHYRKWRKPEKNIKKKFYIICSPLI